MNALAPEIATGVIDCDLHVALPDTHLLLPFLTEYWREQVLTRGIRGLDLGLRCRLRWQPGNVHRPRYRPTTRRALGGHYG